jgi:hypothetical protein
MTYNLNGKSEYKKALGQLRCRWENYIKVNPKERGREYWD